MARLLAFTYAGVTVGNGGSADFHLTGRYRFAHDYDRASLVFEVVVQNDTPATFLASEAALVAAYRTPDQALTVVLSATTRHSYDPAANSGFNIRANARKLGGPEDTATSAKYECSVSVELPANLTGRGGRRSSSVNVSTATSGRRDLTVSGVYTALANNAARAQFAAQVDTYCASILTDLGGTWEKVGTPQAETDDQNKTIRFTRSYAEVVYPQAAALVAAHSALIQPRLSIRRSRASLQSINPAEPLREITADFTASIVNPSADLVNIWENAVRPFMLREVERLCGGGTVAVIREQPLYGLNEREIAASMTMLVSIGLLKARISVSDSEDLGINFKPVWDGNPYSRDQYQGPASFVRVVTKRALSTQPITLGPPSYPGLVLVRQGGNAESWEEGLPGESFTLYQADARYVFVRADLSADGRTGGSTTQVRQGTTGRGRALGGGGGGAAGQLGPGDSPPGVLNPGAGAGGNAAGGDAAGIFGIGAGLSLDFGSSFGIFDINTGGFSLDFKSPQ